MISRSPFLGQKLRSLHKRTESFRLVLELLLLRHDYLLR